MKNSLRPCPSCGNPVSINAAACPKCGDPTVAKKVAKAKRRSGRLWFWGVTLGLIGFVWAASAISRHEEEARLAKLKVENPVEYTRVMAEKAEAQRRATEQAAARKAEREREEQARQTAKAEEAARARQNGFHCLSGWDGSHPDVVRSVKDNLRNPSSFEHIETRVSPVNQKGEHVIVMRYRAQNGFGGMNVEAVIGSFRNSDCSVVTLRSLR